MSAEQLQIAALQQQLLQLQLSTQQATAAAAATHAAALALAVAAGAAPMRAPLVKLATLAHYEGSSTAIEAWLISLRQQCNYYRLPTEAEVLHFAVAHLKGAALEWWNHSSLSRGGAPSSWAQFEAGLRARFQPIAAEELAREKLFALVQGKSNVRAYVDAFRSVAAQLPSVDSGTLISRFRHGLSPALTLLIAPRAWTTLDADIEFIVRVGSAQAAAASSSSSASGSASQMDVSSLAALVDDESGGESGTRTELLLTALLAAMQQRGGSGSGGRGAQGANGTNGPRGLPQIKGLTPEQVKAYMDAGKCFGCASTEHRSRGCPLRRVGPDGRVSWPAPGQKN